MIGLLKALARYARIETDAEVRSLRLSLDKTNKALDNLPTKIGAKVRLRLDLIVDDLEEAAGSMETTPIHKAEAVLPRTHRPES